MEFKILNGAIFLGDAHANKNRQEFYDFLQDLSSRKILPPQIFFLGDMFDLLANTSFTQKFYKKEIALINEISKKPKFFILKEIMILI